MKKYIAVFFALVLVIGALPGGAFAEEDNLDQNSVEENNLSDNLEEPDDSGLLPDSPFYFLKRIIENVKVIFTFNEERKIDVLTNLVQLRAAELEALEQKYDGEELSKKQQSVLGKATKRLGNCAEGLIDRLIGDGEDIEELELTEKQISKLECAFVNLGKAIERIANTEDDDQNGQGNKIQMKMQKYQQRIGHLEQVRAKAPESAQKGLNCAIENAQKQQERWETKHGSDAGKNKERNEGETKENKAEFGEQYQNQLGKQNQNTNGSGSNKGSGPNN